MSLVGNLEDLGLGEILQIVSLSRKSGVLALHSRGREARIIFRNGQVIRANSSSNQQNLGEVLIQKGVIDLSALKQALNIQKEAGGSELLGTILVRHFNVSTETIEDVVREQIESVIYSLFAWAEGNFDFELQDTAEAVDKTKMDPLQFMLEQGLNPQFLAMEGSRIIDEKRHRGESLDENVSTDVPPHPADTVDMAFDLLHVPGGKEEPAPESEPSSVLSAQQKKRLVLLVDDDEETRTAVCSLLESDGYEAVALERSEDALIKLDSFCREGRDPAVVVDLIMPRMDGSGILGGLELLELIGNNFPSIPVLVLTDYHNSDAERKVRGMGFPVMLKPKKTEIVDAATLHSFGDVFLCELARVESCGGQAIPTDKINIGDELRLEMGDDTPVREQPVAQSTGITLLRGMLDELNNPTLGGGIILLVLRFASEFMNRAVILIVKKDEIAGLGQFGISDSEGNADAKIRNMRIPRDEHSLFSEVIDGQLPVKAQPDSGKWTRYFVEQLGGGVPAEFFLGPIVSEGKVVAVLYGDNIPEAKPVGDTDSLEIFLSQAGLAMEKALLQRRLKEKSREEL
ncbi:response regulator [Geotalea sp. SG265]|uniref:response regulator n=1 Tax=Geotalea sp. SG265 TaxID=2922867 RepID=UPI001FAE7BAF|nr:response regulator [Geotalea sp. SG265]